MGFYVILIKQYKEQFMSGNDSSSLDHLYSFIIFQYLILASGVIFTYLLFLKSIKDMFSILYIYGTSCISKANAHII